MPGTWKPVWFSMACGRASRTDEVRRIHRVEPARSRQEGGRLSGPAVGAGSKARSLCVRHPMGLEVKPDLSFPSNRGGFFNDGWVCW